MMMTWGVDSWSDDLVTQISILPASSVPTYHNIFNQRRNISHKCKVFIFVTTSEKYITNLIKQLKYYN